MNNNPKQEELTKEQQSIIFFLIGVAVMFSIFVVIIGNSSAKMDKFIEKRKAEKQREEKHNEDALKMQKILNELRNQ